MSENKNNKERSVEKFSDIPGYIASGVGSSRAAFENAIKQVTDLSKVRGLGWAGNLLTAAASGMKANYYYDKGDYFEAIGSAGEGFGSIIGGRLGAATAGGSVTAATGGAGAIVAPLAAGVGSYIGSEVFGYVFKRGAQFFYDPERTTKAVFEDLKAVPKLAGETAGFLTRQPTEALGAKLEELGQVTAPVLERNLKKLEEPITKTLNAGGEAFTENVAKPIEGAMTEVIGPATKATMENVIGPATENLTTKAIAPAVSNPIIWLGSKLKAFGDWINSKPSDSQNEDSKFSDTTIKSSQKIEIKNTNSKSNDASQNIDGPIESKENRIPEEKAANIAKGATKDILPDVSITDQITEYKHPEKDAYELTPSPLIPSGEKEPTVTQHTSLSPSFSYDSIYNNELNTTAKPNPKKDISDAGLESEGNIAQPHHQYGLTEASALTNIAPQSSAPESSPEQTNLLRQGNFAPALQADFTAAAGTGLGLGAGFNITINQSVSVGSGAEVQQVQAAMNEANTKAQNDWEGIVADLFRDQRRVEYGVTSGIA